MRQTLEQQMTFAGIEAHILNRKENKNLLEFKIGNSFRENVLNSWFSLLENNSLIKNPVGYQRQVPI